MLAAYEEQFQGPKEDEYRWQSMGPVERTALALSYLVAFPLSLPFWLAGISHGFFWLTAQPNAGLLWATFSTFRRRFRAG